MTSGEPDLATVLARFGDDAALLSELAAIFVEETPRRMEAIRAGVRVDDGPAVRAAAHSLKGVLHALGASEAAASAEAIEHHARDGDLDRARILVVTLGGRVDELVATVTTWPALLATTSALIANGREEDLR
jgi:HPt (histidine-containing phosphotransfer) domain-containing protein